MNIQSSNLPAHTQKYVIWADEQKSGGILIYLIGYCPDTLSYYIGMFLDAKKFVPEINPEKTVCAKVKKSSSCQGFTLCIIDIVGPKRKIPTFQECTWENLNIQAY